MKICVIGGGNMGSAIAKALELSGEEVLIYDKDESRRTASLQEATQGVDTVILAIKPQGFPELLPELKPYLSSDPLIISIAAGVPIKTIQEGLDSKRVVRVMPNTPAQIGKGVSGWYSAREITDEEKHIVRRILQSFGIEVEVAREDLIDAITAISGSGPAYVFYFLEALVSAGEKLGFDKETAEKIVLNTVIGASELAQKSETSFSELRKKVTSPGGTTEAAFKILTDKKWKEILEEATRKACDRAKELKS